MIKVQKRNQIDVDDWDELVINTYGKPYSFQQQDGCKSRGIFTLTIPDLKTQEWEEPEMNDEIPFEVNGEEMGVKFDVWLNTTEEEVEEKLSEEDKGFLYMFYERNFYPSIYTLANDLHLKGLIEAGEYDIKIDW